MLIFISSFKILIIFNSGRIKQTCATLVFRKILTLLRMWRHHSASLQNCSKVKFIIERESPYLCCVFISSQYLVWYLRESKTKKTLFCNISNSAKCLICNICMSYKTARVSNVLLVMVADCLWCILFCCIYIMIWNSCQGISSQFFFAKSGP